MDYSSQIKLLQDLFLKILTKKVLVVVVNLLIYEVLLNFGGVAQLVRAHDSYS